MTPGRGAVLAVAIAVAAVSTGCGLGAGPTSEGAATLTVTRDYGSSQMLATDEQDPPESETVLRFLDREADIATRYGGGFVQSIDGQAGQERDGRRSDWFFYVNGVESPVGAAEVHVRGGDRIWWDYRDWTDAMSVPAVVGSWPEPFSQASAGAERRPVEVECMGAKPPCETVADRLAEAGVDAGIERKGHRSRNHRAAAALRLLVGPWSKVQRDPAVNALRGGPADSGVFATFKGRHLVGLDTSAKPARDLGTGSGLVAALRDGDDPPTWVVTGGNPAGVKAAADLLDAADLRDRYAVTVSGGEITPLPVAAGGA
jgi:hypothetical protein